jgi:hypothetical protein
MLHGGETLLTQLQGGAELGFADLGGLQADVGTLGSVKPTHVKTRLLRRL